MQRLIPFLSFHGNAEEAMNFYAGVFPGAKIESLIHFEKDEPGDEGKVLNGVLSFFGHKFMFHDIKTDLECPAFNWATSFYVECRDDDEFEKVFNGLSQGGTVMMGPESILHFKKVAWVTDKYGFPWQPAVKFPQA